eukprot:1360367-Amorphochlora_amoeboformis.AAC.1
MADRVPPYVGLNTCVWLNCSNTEQDPSSRTGRMGSMVHSATSQVKIVSGAFAVDGYDGRSVGACTNGWGLYF